MALTGHLEAQAVHPVHLSTSIVNVLRPLQIFALHFLSKICSSNSSLKFFRALRKGFGAVCPSPHRDVSLMTEAIVSSCITPLNLSRVVPESSLTGFLMTLSRISSIRPVPSLHGMHLPQLSVCMNYIRCLTRSTMHVVSSIIMKPPAPIPMPFSFMAS